MNLNRRTLITTIASLPFSFKAKAQTLPAAITALMNHPAAGYFEAPPPGSGVPLNIPIATVSGTYNWMQMFAGKAVLLDLWASWCAPCLIETPGLDILANQLNSNKFNVVVLKTADPKTDLNKLANIYQQQQLSTLIPMEDASVDGWGFFRAMKVNTRSRPQTAGLPMAALIGPDSREIARTYGTIDDGKWTNPMIADFVAQFSRAWD